MPGGTATRGATGSTTSKKSPYFAGYVVTPKSGGASYFQYVTATFTVPALNCSATPSAQVDHLAGMGGYSEDALQADGIQEVCSGTSPSYEAVDVAASYGGYISVTDLFTPNAGDSITASVDWNSLTGQDNVKVVDSTTGQYYESTSLVDCSYYYPCPTSSAEVLTEGNFNNNGTADFGSASFATVKATGSSPGAKPLNYSKYALVKLTEYGPVSGKVDVQPGTLTSTSKQSAFTNTWKLQK